MLSSVSRRLLPARNLNHLQSCWRRHVRFESTVSYLRNSSNGADLYLVGTAHVSAKSADEVREVIQRVKPRTVMVELCEERAHNVRYGQGPKSLMQIFRDVLKMSVGVNGKAFLFIMQAMYKAVGDMGLEPGIDMKIAMDAADEVGAKLLLGDRRASLTARRVGEVIPMRKLPNLLTDLVLNTDAKDVPEVVRHMADAKLTDIGTTVESVKDRKSVRQLIGFIEKKYPELVDALIHERDAYMVDQLRRCEGTIVAVVGLAHMDGMERRWQEAEGT